MNRRTTLLAAVQTFIPSLLLNILSVPVTIIIIRQLGKDGYGEWMTGMSLTSLFFTLFNFGYRPLFIRRIADCSVDAPHELAVQILIRLLIGLLSVLISLFAAVLLGYHRNLLICTLLSSLSMLIFGCGSAFADVLQGHQNMKPLSAINFFSGIVLTILSLLVASSGGGSIFMSICYIIGPIISTTMLYLYVSRVYFPVSFVWDKSVIIERFNESYLVGAAGIASTLRDRAEHIFVPKLVGIPSYGMFSASIMLSDRLGVVSSSISDAYFSPIARSSKNEFDPVTHLIVTSLITTVPIALIVAFFADIFASILFPNDLVRCSQLIRISIFSLPITALWISMNVSMQATKAHDEAAKASVVASITSMLSSLWLIIHYGLLGAALSQILRPVLGCFAIQKNFRRRFPGVLQQGVTISSVTCGAIMALVLWFGNKIFAGTILNLTHRAPWVGGRTAELIQTLNISITIFLIVKLILWMAISLSIYVGMAVLLKIIPSESIKKLFRFIFSRTS